ncbi:hypothetical protein [Streptomyces sp. AA1529]|uniref:hypothetical protein n=1 Tax=Streptomyces sp. AA1529 TaxID=1203257 RepID=UPI0002F84270|nr:hypothetical protein [Streptomyces sp. AA1529]
MTDQLYATTPADMPPRAPSLDALQRQTVRDLLTGTALKLAAAEEVDLDALEVLAKLLDAQTRAKEADLRRIQHYAAKEARQ